MRIDAPEGNAVRPTSDRLRGAVFSSLGDRVLDSWLLDACAGTGAMGMEAVSRGASGAVFLEPARIARDILLKNLRHARLEAETRVLAMTWQRAIPELLHGSLRFDLVYFDPPYQESSGDDFLRAILPLVTRQGLILLEHPAHLDPVFVPTLRLVKRLRAGGSTVSMLQRSTVAPDAAKIDPMCGEDG